LLIAPTKNGDQYTLEIDDFHEKESIATAINPTG